MTDASGGSDEPVPPATVRSDTAAELDRLLADAQAETRLPSVVAAVVREGQLCWWGRRGAYADADAAAPGPGTAYRIGSITKTMTAILVLQCRDDGLLDLADPIGKHLPGTGYGDVTVRQLLSHSGGVNAEPAGPWWERNAGPGFEELADVISDDAAVLPAGRQYHYSNLAFALLGETVARLRGEEWWSSVQRRIAAPLGLTSLAYARPDGAARGFSVHPFSGRLDDEPTTDTGAMAPAGQLWCSSTDLARYASFWLDPDPGVLDRGTVEEMATLQSGEPGGGDAEGYGLGLRVQGDLIGHTGSMPGFVAGMFVDRSAGVGAVALANATFGRAASLPPAMIAAVTEREPTLPPTWTPTPADVQPGDELLGWWYWGNTPVLVHRRGAEGPAGGDLLLDVGPGSRPTRLRLTDDPDGWLGLDGYFTGERLRVVRDDSGRPVELDLATYPLRRDPYA